MAPISRNPAGTSVGGQFAANSSAESGEQLSALEPAESGDMGTNGLVAELHSLPESIRGRFPAALERAQIQDHGGGVAYFRQVRSVVLDSAANALDTAERLRKTEGESEAADDLVNESRYLLEVSQRLDSQLRGQGDPGPTMPRPTVW